MAVFDPNDWREWNTWFQSDANKVRRRPEEINREVMTRWVASVALCLCFSALAPAGQLAAAFGGLLIAAAVASVVLALLRQERFYAPHLTTWDEATWSSVAGLVLVLSAVSGGPA